MDEKSVIIINEKINELNLNIEKNILVNKDVEEYNLLLSQLKLKEIEIENKLKNSNFYFDKNLGVLKEKSNLVFCMQKMIFIKDKYTHKYKILNEVIEIEENEFESISKYLKNDKELACIFLNDKKIKCLENLHFYLSNFTCGICSINNINSIKTDILYSTDINIIYEINFSQNNNSNIDIVGNIGIFLTNNEYLKDKKFYNEFEFDSIF